MLKQPGGTKKDCNPFKMIDFIDFIVIIHTIISFIWLPYIGLLKNLIKFITIKSKIQERILLKIDFLTFFEIFRCILLIIWSSSYISLIKSPSYLWSFWKIGWNFFAKLLYRYPKSIIYLSRIYLDSFLFRNSPSNKKEELSLMIWKINTNPWLYFSWYIYVNLLLNLSYCTIYQSLSLILLSFGKT